MRTQSLQRRVFSKPMVQWMCGIALLGLATGCKKKPGPVPQKGKQATRAPAPKKAMLFDPGAFDRALARPEKADPLFASLKGQIPGVAKACKASKKYLSSFTWCSQWKGLANQIKPALKAVKRTNPASIRKAVAIGLAGVSALRDSDPFVRYTGLQILEQVMYNLAWKRVVQVRPMLARVVANVVKSGASYHERKQAVRLLGNDGGTAYFRGGVYDGKILAWAAHHDKSHWVRQAALGHLRSCIKRRGDACPVAPAQLRAWHAKETNATARESIARLAGMRKMTKEVFAWCTPRVLSSKMHWGCEGAFKHVINGQNFERFHALATKFRDSAASQTKRNFRMVYVVKLMNIGRKKGFPREKVAAFLRSVLSQPASMNARTRNTTLYAVRGLVRMTTAKKENKALQKFLKKTRRAYAKARKKEKDRKTWLKIFDDALKTLKAKA